MTTPTDHLRLEGAVRYFGGHKHPDCQGDEPEECRCGYGDLLAKLDALRSSEHEHTDQGETDGVV